VTVAVVQIGDDQDVVILVVNARNRIAILGAVEAAIRAASATGRCVSIGTVHATGSACDHHRSLAEGE